MLGIFLWSAVAGALTAVAANAKAELTRAQRDQLNGIERAKAQREVQDFLTRL